MYSSLREVLRAFLALKRLSPIAIVSWDILHHAMTSALLLAGIETVMSLQEAQDLLHKLTKSLASFAGVEESNSEAAAMVVAPYSHFLDTLKYLLDRIQ